MSLSRRMLLMAMVPGAVMFMFACAHPKRVVKHAPPGTKYVTVRVGGGAQAQALAQAVPQTYPIELNARDNGQPGGAGRIVWQADDTKKVLHVEVDASRDRPPVRCLTAVKCEGPSCAGTANASYHGENGADSVRCKYRVWADGMPKPADPEVVVDNCCP